MSALDRLFQLADEGNKEAEIALQNIATEWIERKQQALEQEQRDLDRRIDALMPALVACASLQIEQAKPKYLSLPGKLKVFENDRLFCWARPQGRLWYRVGQFRIDEDALEVVRAPATYDRQYIFDYIDLGIHIPSDAVLAATVPLSFRVGLVVGWLSALSVSQPVDAQAGIVILATMVNPLLCNVPARSRGKSVKKVSHKRLTSS